MRKSKEPCPNHDQHLCLLVSEGLQVKRPKEYHGLVKDPKYVCKSCGRVAGAANNLCNPTELGAWEE